ncbi:MAG TPA: Flp pilus assembly protein CpaB [Candidatus Aquilonibacter sp.]|nr:Flp pilus assembly protein CpaB [Candidatus Aquilonibacter sp.]
MNRSRLLMIGALALALGGLVSVAVYKNLLGRGPATEPGVEVVVAADDIQVGARIEEHDIRLVRYPASALPAGTPTKRSQVLGRGVILPISKGEFILPGKLAPENAGAGLPALIPPGMRAVSVRVNEVVSVANFVGPGTRVDVLLTGTPNGSSESQTTTVLQNVAVIAAGHNLERNAAGEAQNVPVITLLTSPEDAERLTLANSEGKIQLVLRNPLDTHQDPVDAANARQLYKNGTPVVAPRPVVHAVRHKVEPAPAPSVLSVEVYQGDKKTPDVLKFPEGSSDDPK